jgi:DNA-binding response OmpR family regulator
MNTIDKDLHSQFGARNSPLILIVEDNQNLNDINRRALELQGYTVLTAFTLAQARAHLKTAEPDVILLDITLPDGDGMDFAAQLNENSAVTGQIVFLTAKASDEDRYRGLGVGDDYITKPFAPADMIARVEAAVLRRQRHSRQRKLWQKGSLKLDFLSGQAFLNGTDLLLTQKEFAVLWLLAQNARATLAAQSIYESVWKAPMNEDNQSLRIVISRLRKKLGSGFSISNEYNNGYCFAVIEN